MGDKHIKKTAVIVQQLYVLRQHKNAAPEVCDQCPIAIASLVTPDEAAIVTGISTRAIYRWVEARIIHFRETANGSLLVCLNSFPTTEDVSSLEEI
jgi:hypothetical protein